MPPAFWGDDEFHSSVRLSALTEGLAIAVFLHDAGGARSIGFEDLRRAADQTAPRLDGQEYMLHFIRGNDGWTCNGITVDVNEW